MQNFPVRSGSAASLLVNLGDNPLLFRLALQIELIQLFRNIFAAGLVFAGEEFNHVARHIHPSGGIDARPQSKSYIAGAEARSPVRPETSINALSPPFTGRRSPSRPKRAIVRFSPTSGTASAMVAMATILRNDGISLRLIDRVLEFGKECLRNFECDARAA